MPSAIDVFREQREAPNSCTGECRRLRRSSAKSTNKSNALALNNDLRAMLREEQDWLTRAQLAVSEIRLFREQDMLRFCPGVIRRWTVALVFALMSAAAAVARYARVTKPYADELAALRSRVGFADFVEHRVLTMTPAERRQFDTLMKWKPPRQ